MATKDLKKVHEFLWKKYVEYSSDLPPNIDDNSALEVLQEYYENHPLESHKEFYFYGILLFEVASECPERQLDYWAKAKVILDKYRAFSGETDWEEIEDRLEDIDQYLKEKDLLAQVTAAGETLIHASGGLLETLERSEVSGPDLPPDMVLIPEGHFIFADGVEKTLPAFLMDRYPVSNSQFQTFLEDTGYRKPKFVRDNRFNRPEQPVVGISLMDAKKYARWSGKDIPTEEQWEKACRGSDGRPFPWGDTPPSEEQADFGQNPEEGGAVDIGNNGDGQSEYGCENIVGSVWEWTNTSHESVENNKVIRGGSWCDSPRYINCTSRLPVLTREKSDNLGFRCCKSI